MICLTWVALQGMAHSFIELHKAAIHVIILVFCDCGFHSGGHGIEVLVSSVCPLTDEDKRLGQASCWEGLAMKRTRSFLVDGAKLSRP